MSRRKKIPDKRHPQDRSVSSLSSSLSCKVLAGIILIAMLAFLAYFPSLNGGFIWDDKDVFLAEKKVVKNPDGLYKFWCTNETTDYWPLTYSSFWIEWRLWKINTAGYHITNLIFHVAESLLIWIILRKLSIPGGFLAGMIFALHPVNVESVAWIAELKDVLAVLFFLLSILWYLKVQEASGNGNRETESDFIHPSSFILHPLSLNTWYCLSLAAFVLAMLSKGSVAILPVLLLGIIWWLRPLIRPDFVRIAPYFLVALVLTGVNIWFQTHGTGPIRNASFTERLLGAGSVLWFYLYKALLPINLSFVYPQWQIKAGNVLWWLPLLAALIMTVVSWRYRKSWSRPLLFAWGFFCVALLPMMGFTDVYFMTYSLVADHYQHIAIIGIIALAASTWNVWRRSAPVGVHRTANVIAVVVVGVLALMTWRQSGLYRDEITLYQATLKKNPECWMAHTNLGFIFGLKGQINEQIEHYKQAVKLHPDYPEAHNNLALLLMENGRIPEAIEYFKQALKWKPDYAEARNNLGSILIKTGQTQEAIENFRYAIKINPNYLEALNNLGSTLAQTGQPQEAIKYLQKASRLKPDDVEIRNNLGNALRLTGQNLQAIEQYKYALRLDSDLPMTHNNLGLALEDVGQHDEAIEHYKKALSINPDYFEAHDNLGQEFMHMEKPKEAIEKFKQAIRIKPDYFRTYMYLARAYAKTNQSAEAISAAQKALELARSQGQMEMAGQIEDWLKNYLAGPPDLPDSTPIRKPSSSTP